MSNPTIKIHNTETNEVIEREMTNDELDIHLANPLIADEA